MNDLDLEAHGETWKRPLVRRDDTNNVERIVMPSASSSSKEFDIVVKGVRLPTGQQPFALVATDNIMTVEAPVEAATSSSSGGLSSTSKGLLGALIVVVVAPLAIAMAGAVVFPQNRRKTAFQNFGKDTSPSV